MTQEKETTAALSIQEFAQICKDVDLEIESEFAGIFAQKRTYEKAADYISALSDPLVPVKSAWDNTMELGGFSWGWLRDLAFYTGLEVEGDSR